MKNNLVDGMTETNSTRIDLELSAFTIVTSPFFFKNDFRYKTCDNTVNTGAPRTFHSPEKRVGFRIWGLGFRGLVLFIGLRVKRIDILPKVRLMGCRLQRAEPV